MEQDWRQVTAIDVGWRNFAWCTLDTAHLRQPLQWHVEDLWQPSPQRRRQPTKDDLMRIATEWCDRHDALLRSSDMIVLENQMRTPCIILNAAIYSRCYNRAHVVHPMTVGAYWKLPTTREAKKARAVAIVDRIVNGNYPAANKRDDLADTFLMAAWAMCTTGAATKEDFLLPQ